MPLQIVITIPPAFEAEVREAVQMHMGLDAPATDDQVQQWVRGPLKNIVLNLRASKQPDIDRTDPTQA